MTSEWQYQKKPASNSSSTPPVQSGVLWQRPFSDPIYSQPSSPKQTQPNIAKRAGFDSTKRKIFPQSPAPVQAKLTVGEPGDKYEQEADSMASKVMAMPAPEKEEPIPRDIVTKEEESVQREIAPGENEKENAFKSSARPDQTADGNQADTKQTMEVSEEFQPEHSDVISYQSVNQSGVGADESREQKDEAVTVSSAGFTDEGRTGSARYGDAPIADNNFPHAYTDGGQTGTVVWAGGGGAGAHGNQPTGSVQVQVAPVFSSQKLSASDSEAWVKIGTGRLDVTRSWVGINAGDQKNGHFVTPAAAARINQHETLHVKSTEGHYKTHIQPPIDRVGSYYAGIKTVHATTQAAAINDLRKIILWPESVSAFQKADLADNKPGGTVDTNDVNSGTYPVDAGPGTVSGKKFKHRLRLPSEPNPI